MKKSILICLILLGTLGAFAQNQTYYINQNTPANGGGDDSNSGLSPATAWKTIAKANSVNLQAGDKVLLFSAGPWHGGNFNFDKNDAGTPTNPITISIYGPNAAANIWSAGEFGFYGDNTGSIIIKNINFYGERTFGGANTASGIQFYAEGALTHKPYILIDSCRLEGYGMQGILIQSWNADAARAKGFSDITIKNTIIVNCGRSGINIGAFGDEEISSAFVHKNILIENVRASSNAGSFGFTEFATGNGIVVSSAENVLIEKCVADYNGFLNSHVGGGIAGIWFYNVKDGIIQHSESFGNFSGLELDGNGFGIDGGCRNCIIQYCYSHDNEGCGYGMFEFGSPNGYNNNNIRYNISQNDGRKNSFGAFKLWGVSQSNKLNNANIYNNSVYLNAANLINTADLPVGVRILTNNMNNVKIMNNAFYLDDESLSFTRSVDITNVPTAIAANEVLMLNNFYHKTSGTPNFSWGTNYNSLAAWQTGTSQEIYNATNYGYTTNPGFSAPGTGVAFAPPFNNTQGNQTVGFGTDITGMTAYKLIPNANAIGTGLNLNSLFGLNIGTRDYYNVSLNTTVFDNGASQTGTTLPLADLKSFTASSTLSGNAIKWSLHSAKSIIKFDVEAKTDAKDFQNVSGGILATDRLEYSFMHYNNDAKVYYRIKGTDKDGLIWYSDIKLVTSAAVEKASIYPNPLNSNSIMALYWAKNEVANLKVYNTNGQVKFAKKIALTAGYNSISLSELANLTPATYIISVAGSANDFSQKIIKQ